MWRRRSTASSDWCDGLARLSHWLIRPAVRGRPAASVSFVAGQQRPGHAHFTQGSLCPLILMTSV